MEKHIDEARQINVCRCTWDEFIKEVRGSQQGCVFRGQRSVEWRLLSPFHRKWKGFHPLDMFYLVHGMETNEIHEKHKENYLATFKSCMIGNPGVDTRIFTTPNEWWAYARHFGLITPLMDWTRSPYVAVFFAIVDTIESFGSNLDRSDHANLKDELAAWNNGVVAVWKLDRKAKGNCEIADLSFVEDQLDICHRQKAQQGLFTTLNTPDGDLEAYLFSKTQSLLLTRYEIPANETLAAMRDLQLMNITYATLFPDPEGAAKQANMEIYLRFISHNFYFAAQMQQQHGPNLESLKPPATSPQDQN